MVTWIEKDFNGVYEGWGLAKDAVNLPIDGLEFKNASRFIVMDLPNGIDTTPDGTILDSEFLVFDGENKKWLQK